MPAILKLDEYSSLREFLEPRILKLWSHEQKTKKDVAKIVQAAFSYPNCEKRLTEDENIWFCTCYSQNFLKQVASNIALAQEKYPDSFGTGDAMDVLTALYDVSGYYREINDYITYLKEHSCCYIAYNIDGEWSEDILCIRLFSMFKEHKEHKGVHEFIGGLLHSLKHFSIEGKNLSTGTDVNDVFDVEHIVYLTGLAFRNREPEPGHRESDFIAYQETNNGRLYYSFYKELESSIYFLNSCHRI